MKTLKAHLVLFVTLSPSHVLNAQLNPVDAAWTSWSPTCFEDYQAIVSTINTNAVCTDSKRWDLLPKIFTQDAIASYTAGANISYGIDAIRQVHVDGIADFITQYLQSNFLVSVADDGQTANASYFTLATLFTNPQQTPGQYINLYGYYNDKLIRTPDGWGTNYLEYRFFGPGWAGNISILPPGFPMASPASYEPPSTRRD